MIDRKRDLGPIEQELARSDNSQLQQLCQMDNGELLDYMDQLIDMGDDFDEELFDAAQQLLNERAPIEKPSAAEAIQSWEKFKSKCPEVFQTADSRKAKPAKRTYTLRRSIAFAALVATLIVGLTAGAWAATNIDFQDLGEVVIRNLKYGESGQMENWDPMQTGYASLAEAIRETGGSDAIECATWIPSDFAITGVTVTTNENGIHSYWAYYESGSRSLAIVIFQSAEMPVVMEKNPDTAVEEMRWRGYDYLIVNNCDYVNCEWDKDGYSYSVVGGITTDELKSVVKSFK